MKTSTTFSSPLQLESFFNSFVAGAKRLFQSSLFQGNIGSFSKPSEPSTFSSRMSSMQQFKKHFKKNYIVILPIVIVFIVIIVLVGNFFSQDSRSSVQGAQDNRTQMNKPLAVEELDKSYTFTVTDSSGKPVKVKFTIQNVELRDQIVLRGQPVVAVEGRVFLIANLKIVNASTTNVGMMTRDYLRLTVDSSSDKLAPEIHNDPVQVQAISTKLTRVGFAIDDTAKKLELQVGEIDGKKETVELHLQN